MLRKILPVIFCTGLCLVAAEEDQKKKKKPQTWAEKAAARFGKKPLPRQKAEISSHLPDATATPKKNRRVLCFWRCEGFIHTSIPFCNYAVEQMAESTNAYQVDLAAEYDVFTAKNLAKYDAILFNNTTNLTPNEEQRNAILDFVEGGKGIIGIHAASDNFKRWDDGIAMIGGVFDGHPWTGGGTWAFKLDDPDHPLNASFKEQGFWHKDEIYWYKPENFEGRDKLRVLLSLDMSKPANVAPLNKKKFQEQVAKRVGKEASAEKVDVPVSWIREIGKGRLFYTNLGHNDATFSNRVVLQHVLDGMQYALGDIEADAVPSSGLKKEATLAPEEPVKK